MSLPTTGFMNISSENNPRLNTVNYQPNFILLGDKKNLFGDIIPVYRNYQELSDIIISSKESLARMVFVSSVFFVCLFSLVLESINNIAYQSLLFVSSIKNQVYTLPDYYNNVKKSFIELSNILTNQETRDLWWLDFKLEFKQNLNLVQEFFSSFINVISKFYLSSIVIIVLGIISSSSFTSTASLSNQNSLLGKALENHTTNSVIVPSTQTSIPILSLLKQESDTKDLLLSSQVITHTVQPGETVDIIAEMYGLTPETVIFNNQLDESKALPQQMYLPWSEGYLYQTKADTSLEDLERIYGVDKNLIYSLNEDLLDREKDIFPSNTFILIPSTDYIDIANSNSKEDLRKQNLENSKLQKNNIKKASATVNNKLAKTFSNNKSSGFIWPTTGNISRCVTGAHIACDIANFSAPPVFAVQRGVVSRVAFEGGGYGNVVLIDHGNGLVTLYAHLSQINGDIKPGKEVIQGESIGQMGRTGRSTGIHLHFEVRLNGVKQNPLSYLP